MMRVTGLLTLVLLAGAAPQVGASAAAATRDVPVTACPISGSGPGAGPASVATSISVPSGTKVFATSDLSGARAYVLGPSGYVCTATGNGADGGLGIVLMDPSNQAHTVRAIADPGGIGLNLDLSCPYIPYAHDAAQAFFGSPQTDVCAHADQDQITQIPTGTPDNYLAVVRVPPNVSDTTFVSSGGSDATVALITFRGSVSGSAIDAESQEADCTLPVNRQDVCAAALAFFLSQSEVGKNMGAHLAPALDMVNNFVSPVPSTYVAMGDSYSSGEGADWPPGHMAQEPGCDWYLYHDPAGHPSDTDHLENTHAIPRCLSPAEKDRRGNTCHRAITAYAHVVLGALGNPGPTLRFVACSGDTLHDALNGHGQQAGPNTRVGETSQLGALDENTSLVTLTVGGNDLDFPGNAKTCVTPTKNEYDCLNPDQPDTGSNARPLLQTLGYDTTPGGKNDGNFNFTLKAGSKGTTDPTVPPKDLTPKNLSQKLADLDKANNQLPNLHDRLILYYRTIHQLAPTARILVLGYPRFFPTSTPAAAHFSSQEAQWINDRIALADSVIHDAAARSGVAQYVDVYNALDGHELGTGDYDYTVSDTGQVTCRSGEYINDIDLAHGFFGSPELLHPNPCGHQAEAQLVASAYLNPPYAPDTFRLPQLPPAGVITGKDQHGHFSFGCHATFTATVNKARENDVASYTWFDATGNERGTGTTLDMASAPNSFQLYLRTTGTNGQVRYSFYHGPVC